MTSSRPPFPAVIDSTLVGELTECPGKTFLKSFLHYKPKLQSVHLHAGKAFASGLEATRRAFYEEQLGTETSIGRGLAKLIAEYGDFECPSDSAKSLERMLGALEFYFSQYPLATDSAKPARLSDNRLGIEFGFLEPIDIKHPVTGDPLLYSGRFDMIADYANGLYGEDDKTASQLGASWHKQWDLRSQFTAYCWGAARHGIHLEGFLVRGVSILKTKYDTQQAITYRPRWMIDHWYEQMLAKVKRMIQYWESGNWEWALGDACNSYGGCEFRPFCLAQPDRQQAVLRTYFTRRLWDPVARVETDLGDV
jgi:hypothetical protein